jgi:hypothetical protein
LGARLTPFVFAKPFRQWIQGLRELFLSQSAAIVLREPLTDNLQVVRILVRLQELLPDVDRHDHALSAAMRTEVDRFSLTSVEPLRDLVQGRSRFPRGHNLSHTETVPKSVLIVTTSGAALAAGRK